MRILWCTHSVAGFKDETSGYNGCGWITSLLQEFKKYPGNEIGIAFYNDKGLEKVERDGVYFYPMERGHISLREKIVSFTGSMNGWIKEEKKHLKILKEVVADFNPDVIHVWGTETDMGLIAGEVLIPVIIHLQGILHPYNNALCPPSFSRYDFMMQNGFSPINMLKNLNGLQYWRYKAERETRIFKVCRYYFGRTKWDKSISHFFAPDSNYHYCSELLRDDFYTKDIWQKHTQECLKIVSTISSPLYKGVDLVLKTAKLLKKYSDIQFEWNIVGIKSAPFIEKHIGINAHDVNVNYLGVKTASEIKELELSSSLYVHPSYIENSPNSVCEAQMLGMPVIAVMSGGVSSLIEENITGFLVPSNEPHILAAMIVSIYNEDGGLNSATIKSKAHDRHSKETIIHDLLAGYTSILQQK